MTNVKLREVKQQLAALSFDEKLTVTSFLVEQLELDRKERISTPKSENGHAVDSRVPATLEEPDPDRRREYAWLKEHRDEYAGQYVALSGDELVAQAPSLKELYKLVNEIGAYRPFFVRIEAKDEPPFGGW